MRFWDSSALVPLILDESFSRRVRALWVEEPSAVVWWSTIIECVGSVARAERAGALSLGKANEALRALAALRNDWQEIGPTERLREIAQQLLRVHPLRAADALQLAAAHVASERVPRSLAFVSLDTRLIAAAAREGFVIVEP